MKIRIGTLGIFLLISCGACIAAFENATHQFKYDPTLIFEVTDEGELSLRSDAFEVIQPRHLARIEQVVEDTNEAISNGVMAPLDQFQSFAPAPQCLCADSCCQFDLCVYWECTFINPWTGLCEGPYMLVLIECDEYTP